MHEIQITKANQTNYCLLRAFVFIIAVDLRFVGKSQSVNLCK